MRLALPAPMNPISFHAAIAAGLAAAVLLAGCASGPPALPGEPVDDVLRRLGPPGAEAPLPDGGRQLEYASGPFGKWTIMVRLDAQGRVVSAGNVLDEAHFAQVQPGMTRDALRLLLGPPARVWGVRYHDQTVWSYRYETPLCQLFHVGITPQGVVEDTSHGPDPMCERDLFNGPNGQHR